MQHCRAVASEMLSVQPEEEVAVGDEWIRYQEIEVTEDDVKLRIDKLWHTIFSSTDASGEHFVILPKMVKYAFTLCHSNADVKRSFSANKGILTMQNIFLSEETIIGIRVITATVEECGGVNKNSNNSGFAESC